MDKLVSFNCQGVIFTIEKETLSNGTFLKGVVDSPLSKKDENGYFLVEQHPLEFSRILNSYRNHVPAFKESLDFHGVSHPLEAVFDMVEYSCFGSVVSVIEDILNKPFDLHARLFAFDRCDKGVFLIIYDLRIALLNSDTLKKRLNHNLEKSGFEITEIVSSNNSTKMYISNGESGEEEEEEYM